MRTRKGLFSQRANGEAMVTLYLPVHVVRDDVVWVAERLGVSELGALRRMRAALLDVAGRRRELYWVVANGVVSLSAEAAAESRACTSRLDSECVVAT